VQIKRFFVVVSVVLAAGWVSAGCSESDSRRAARKLNEATQTASKLTARSQALAANPYFLVGGNASPVASTLVSESDIKALRDQRSANRPLAEREQTMARIAEQMVKARVTLVPPEQLHPEAITSLERARDLLQKAIDEAGNVTGEAETAKAIALAKLASIQIDLGHLYRRNFENARSQAVELAAAVELNARQAEWERILMAALDGLLEAKFDTNNIVSYEQALKNFQALLEEVNGEVTTLTNQVKALNAERAALQTAINNLSQEATDKLLSSQAVVLDDFEQSETLFEESVALNEQVIAKSQEMGEKDLVMAELENLLAIAQAKLLVLTSGKAAPVRVAEEDEDAPAAAPAKSAGKATSAGSVPDAEAVFKNYTTQVKQRLEAFRKESQARRSESETQCVEGLKAIGEQYRLAMDLADKADKCAVKQFELAVTNAKTSYGLVKDPAAKALEGAALREYGAIRLQQRDMLSSVLKAVSMVPRASSRDVIGDVNSAVAIKDWGTAAAEKFNLSADAFHTAASDVSRNQRGHQAWVYQTNEAISRMQQAMLAEGSQRSDAENEAATLLSNALNNRENSPYLRYVRMANTQLQQQRTAVAVPIPASPTPAANSGGGGDDDVQFFGDTIVPDDE